MLTRRVAPGSRRERFDDTCRHRVDVPVFVGEAGVARRDISPPVGIRARNWGPATWNASEGNHHAMTLTAVALRSAESGGLSYLLLAVDGTWWRRVDDERRVRGAILEQLGLDPSALMLGLSHTRVRFALSTEAFDF